MPAYRGNPNRPSRLARQRPPLGQQPPQDDPTLQPAAGPTTLGATSAQPTPQPFVPPQTASGAAMPAPQDEISGLPYFEGPTPMPGEVGEQVVIGLPTEPGGGGGEIGGLPYFPTPIGGIGVEPIGPTPGPEPTPGGPIEGLPVEPVEPVAPQPPVEPGAPPVEPTPDDPGIDQYVSDELRRRLLEMLQESVGEVDPNDPALVARRNAFLRGQNRGLERQRNALAERNAAEGTLETGGFDTDVNQLYTEATGREADFEANLIGEEIQGQRARLQQAMALAAEMGDSEAARNLQLQIAEMDQELRRLGITSDTDLRRQALALQERLGLSDLELRRMLGVGNLGLGIGQLGLSAEELRQRGQLHGQDLGFNYWRTLQEMQNENLNRLITGLG